MALTTVQIALQDQLRQHAAAQQQRQAVRFAQVTDEWLDALFRDAYLREL